MVLIRLYPRTVLDANDRELEHGECATFPAAAIVRVLAVHEFGDEYRE
ncbi:MAG: hypothetical protein NVSMB52_07150 [Chloroflexota bacterium]